VSISQEEAQTDRAAALFVQQCASCHGETGDGRGWTELDRPARSFRDGGFSYGNTPKAIFRTLTTGIPGTPMPGFDLSVSEEERKALAEYVITLGPPLPQVERSDTIMELGEDPVIVRGMLPPIASGATAHTRGLLIGMPSGMSFEYRIDDVRLLGLRQGDFCERTDWVGRGGTELKPLGQVVHLMENGDPRPMFWRDSKALETRMLGTWVRGPEAGVRYRLRTEAGGTLADVEESVRVVSADIVTGFRRSLRFDWTTTGEIDLRVRHPGEGRPIGFFPAGGLEWVILRREDGFYECRGSSETWKETSSLKRIELGLQGSPGSRSQIELITLISPEWSQRIRDILSEVHDR
jgi:hypothetical protein